MNRVGIWVFLLVTGGLTVALWVQHRALVESRSAAEVGRVEDDNGERPVITSPAIPVKIPEAEQHELLRLRGEVAVLRVATNRLVADLQAASNALEVTLSAFNAQARNQRRRLATRSMLQAEAERDANSGRAANPPRTGAWIGINMQDAGPLAAVTGVEKGVLIPDMVRQGPADRAGVKPGDVIVKADGQEIGGPSEFKAFLAQKAAGGGVVLDIVRDGKPIKVEVRTREWPN